MRISHTFLLHRQKYIKFFSPFSSLNSFIKDTKDPISFRKFDLSDMKMQIYKIPNLKDIISFAELQNLDFHTSWHHSLNIDFFKKLNQIAKQENEFNEKSIQFCKSLLEKIDEKMTYLFNPKENNDALIQELLDLQSFFIRQLKIDSSRNIFLNPIFVKSILKSKNTHYTYRLIVLICENNAISRFVNTFPLFTLAEMLFLSWKLSTLLGDSKRFVTFFEETKKDLFSLKRFKEISSFPIMRMYMVAIKRYENNFLMENKEVIVDWFFKLFENENWPLHEVHIIFIIDVIKQTLKTMRETTIEKLEKIKIGQALQSQEGMICFTKVIFFITFYYII